MVFGQRCLSSGTSAGEKPEIQASIVSSADRPEDGNGNEGCDHRGSMKGQIQLQRRVAMESAVSATFAVWPAHATVMSLASPGLVSTRTSEPSEFFAAA